MKKSLLIPILFLCSYVSAQQHIFCGFQADYGPFFRSFDNNKNMLKGSNIGRMLNIRLSGSYRIFDQITLEGGMSLNGMKYKIKDVNFEERNEGFESLIQTHNRFMSFYTNLKYSYNLGRKQYLFLRTGYEFSSIGGGQESASKTLVAGDNFDKLDITLNYGQNNHAFVPEVGFEYFNNQGNLITLGLKYHMKFSGDDFIRGDYQVTNKQNLNLSDGVNISGSYVALTAQFNGLLSYKSKKERIKKPKKVEPVLVDVPEPEPEVVDTTKQVEIDNKTANDRDYAITHKVKVKNKKIKVYIWDHQIEDGDRVNLILNEDWILTDYTLENKKLMIEVTLEEGSNHFILYALNLGTYQPNTAAIIIDDGVKQHQVILESTLDESSAIEIKYDGQ